jgi:hypothetical protein
MKRTALQKQTDKANILNKYGINGIFAREMNKLSEFKLVMICDDSTSMREVLNKGKTKWDELRDIVETVLDIANVFEVECDVLFLNRPGIHNCKYFEQLKEKFVAPPYGSTPLKKCFDLALKMNGLELKERKLLVIIFTDGCPTSDILTEADAIKEFENTLKKRNPIKRIFVTITACTDDEHALAYLNNWDKSIKNLDVVDDYENEKREIIAAGRLKTAFTRGNYIAKVLLGSFVKEIDELDEKSKACTIL